MYAHTFFYWLIFLCGISSRCFICCRSFQEETLRKELFAFEDDDHSSIPFAGRSGSSRARPMGFPLGPRPPGRRCPSVPRQILRGSCQERRRKEGSDVSVLMDGMLQAFDRPGWLETNAHVPGTCQLSGVCSAGLSNVEAMASRCPGLGPRFSE